MYLFLQQKMELTADDGNTHPGELSRKTFEVQYVLSGLIQLAMRIEIRIIISLIYSNYIIIIMISEYIYIYICVCVWMKCLFEYFEFDS